MAEFIVNMTLFVALLVLLVVWAISANRRRRRDRRGHAQDRLLILGAITAAAGGAPVSEEDVDHHSQIELDVAPEDRAHLRHSSRTGTRRSTATTAQRLDPDSIIALLDRLGNRKFARRGVFASLFASPGSVWSAGIRAGRSIAAKTISNPGARDRDEDATGAQLYREAAVELVDIYAHNPEDARTQYATFVAVLGDPVLAELYVRSAVYSTQIEHQQVGLVVNNITRGLRGTQMEDGPRHEATAEGR